MGYAHVKQANWRKIREVAKANVETILATATQCTEAYRKANLTVGTHLMELQDWTNGLILQVELTNDAEVAAGIAIWGYAENGPAILIDTVGTIAGGTQVSDDGGFWAESFVPADAGAHTVTNQDATGFIGQLLFDTKGLKYIYVQVTAIAQASGSVKVWARPW